MLGRVVVSQGLPQRFGFDTVVCMCIFGGVCPL